MVLVKEPTTLVKVGVASFYSFVSITLVLFNKNMFATFGFDSPTLLTVFQSITGILLTRILHHLGFIKLENIRQDQFIRIIPLAMIYLSNILFGLMALQYINIPIYNTLRRSGIVLVILVEYRMYQRLPSLNILYSVAVIIFGTVLAGAKDLTFDIFSYTIAIIANLLTALYIVLVKHYGKMLKMEPLTLLYYNNILSLPMAAVISLGMQDSLLKYNMTPAFLFNLFICVLFSFLLNVGIYFNTNINSPLTQSILGQVKGYIQLIFGLFMFRDYIYEFYNVLGMSIAMIGGLLYAYISYVEKENVKSKI
eukprot:NODE_55_length_29507_cov_0.809712.p13 type:complete len:309 gc:universal NODE_55_length_29507_cov_0.809712:21739-20813(-)